MNRDVWNERYGAADLVWHAAPNQFLPPEVADRPAGRAVDLAAGEGRNALWLAEQGWTVTGVDFSDVGLAKAARLAADRGVEVEWVLADLLRWEADRPYDLVIQFYLQLPADERRAVNAAAARAVAPGGVFLAVGHDLVNLTEGYGGPQSPAVLATPDDVVDDLRAAGVDDLEIVRSERVTRRVSTEEGERVAIDLLVRAERRAR